MPISQEMMRRIETFAREEEERQQLRMQQREDIAESAEARRFRLREERLRGVRETPGRMGMVDPSSRASTRRSVVGRPPVQQLGIEMAPGSIGAGVGAVAGGALAGPVGAVGGAMAGGTLGELLGQETGLTPESDAGVALAAGAPLGGPVMAGAGKLIKKGVGGSVRGLPMVREARGIRAQREFEDIRDNFGARVFAQQQGMMAQPSRDLFRMLDRADPSLAHNTIKADSFKGSFAAIKDLRKEAVQLAEFPQGRQALAFLSQMEKNLQRGDFTFNRLYNLRSYVGSLTESNNQKIAQSAKRLYKSLSDDLDSLADSAKPAKGFARVAQTASKRAKLEFAVQDIEQGVARHLKPIPGEETDTIFEVAEFRKWLLDKTNPKSASYDKNMVNALGSELDNFKKQLSDLHKIADESRIGGPGALVVQGVAAGTGAGIGGAIAGPAGMTVGALAGVSGPKRITALLANPRTAKILRVGAKAGRGRIPVGALSTASEILAQMMRSTQRQQEETFDISR